MMPIEQPRPCNHPGCPALTRDRFCEAHRKQRQQVYHRSRGTSAQRDPSGPSQRRTYHGAATRDVPLVTGLKFDATFRCCTQRFSYNKTRT